MVRAIEREPALHYGRAQRVPGRQRLLQWDPSRHGGQTAKTPRPSGRSPDPGPHLTRWVERRPCSPANAGAHGANGGSAMDAQLRLWVSASGALAASLSPAPPMLPPRVSRTTVARSSPAFTTSWRREVRYSGCVGTASFPRAHAPLGFVLDGEEAVDKPSLDTPPDALPGCPTPHTNTSTTSTASWGTGEKLNNRPTHYAAGQPDPVRRRHPPLWRHVRSSHWRVSASPPAPFPAGGDGVMDGNRQCLPVSGGVLRAPTTFHEQPLYCGNALTVVNHKSSGGSRPCRSTRAPYKSSAEITSTDRNVTLTSLISHVVCRYNGSATIGRPANAHRMQALCNT